MPVLRPAMNNCQSPGCQIKIDTPSFRVFPTVARVFALFARARSEELAREGDAERMESYACRKPICRLAEAKKGVWN